MATLSSSEKPAHAKSALPPECLTVREQLDAYVDGEVSEAEAAQVIAHVAGCTMCQQAETALRRFLSAVRHTQLPVLASRRLRLRIAQLFAAEQDSELRHPAGD